MNYCECSFTWLIFVLNCVVGSDENTRLTVLNFLNFTSSLLMLFFVQPLSRNCYKLPSIVTFWSKCCLLYRMAPCWQAVWRVIFKIRVIFGVLFERRTVDKQEYVLWNAVSVPLLQFARYCSIVQTLSLKYIWVATLTLRLYDVVGHLITLFAIFNLMCFIRINLHILKSVRYSFNRFVATST